MMKPTTETLEILLRARDTYAEYGVARHPRCLGDEVCLATAVRQATPGCDARGTIEALAPFVPITKHNTWSSVIFYNDTHTKAENLALLDRVIEAERAKLATNRVANTVSELLSAASVPAERGELVSVS